VGREEIGRSRKKAIVEPTRRDIDPGAAHALIKSKGKQGDETRGQTGRFLMLSIHNQNYRNVPSVPRFQGKTHPCIKQTHKEGPPHS
jgi:hypothetical protein